MGFEVFEKRHFGGRPRSANPEIGIQKAGQFSLNQAAFSALGEPEAVLLYFDEAGQRVGLRPTLATDPRAFAVKHYRKEASTRLVAGRLFLNHYSIDYSEARRLRASMVDSMLVAPLKTDAANDRSLRAVS